MKPSALYDVIVVGGGPAGMMAAGRAAECGARVLLLEKNPSLGKKLLITGGGRCNVTNAEFDVRRLLGKFRNSKQFLFSPFSQFGVEATLAFFHERNMPTKVEAENRVFPTSNSSQSVWDVLVKYMKAGNVVVEHDSPVIGLEQDGKHIAGVRLKNKSTIRAKSFILATGGKSRPETGSTGDGFAWLKALGHTVTDAEAALVPLRIKEPWIKRLAGVSLKDVKLTISQDGKPHQKAVGKMLFTHFGVSGPLVLNMSRAVSEILPYAPVSLELDLRPGADQGDLDKELQAWWKDKQNKIAKNCLTGFLPPALAPVFLEMAGIDPEKPVNVITRTERLALIKLIKKLPMTVSGLMGLDKAVVTSGGVDLKEVDFKTMRSKKYDNLYIVGDVLNIDRPSGGYSLQLCWTTGFVAGTNAADSK